MSHRDFKRRPDGTVQLAPLDDFAPMYLDREMIARTSGWRGPQNETLTDWRTIIELLPLDEALKLPVAHALARFGATELPRLEERLDAADADADVIESCKPAIEQQILNLQRLDAHV